MKKLVTFVVLLLLTAGCGSEFGTGAAAGTGIGAAFMHTLTGAKADLMAREEALIEAYNEGVEMGMAQEDLDGIKREIEWMRRGQEGVEVGEQFLGLDWENPKQTGLAMGSLIELALIIFGSRKLIQVSRDLKGTKAGVAKFCGISEPEVASKLHDTIKEKNHSSV